jgi:hypothetical protein
MPIIKKKMSTSAYILIALLIVAIIALPILHFTDILDLSFLGTGFEDIMLWASEETLNGVLLLGGVFAGGALSFYIVKTYLLGTQIPATTPVYSGGYNPQPTQPSQPQQEDETVIT